MQTSVLRDIPRVLPTPPTHRIDQLTYILSLTGCTRLKAIPQTRELNGEPIVENFQPFMKQRHGRSKGIDINAIGELTIQEKKRSGTAKKKPASVETEPGFKNNLMQCEDKPIYSHRVNKKEVRRRITGMINAQRHGRGTPTLFFFTVSFPPCINDKIGFQLLNTWLTRIRKWRKKVSYLWVAERQQNGTIHFHIAVPHLLNVVWINRFMRAAIITQIKKGKIDWNIHAAKKYNGVDIAGKRFKVNGKWKKQTTNFALENKGGSLANYLSKYVTKNDSGFEFSAWRCSWDFSALVHTVNVSGQELKDSQLHTYLDRSKIRETEFFFFAFWVHPPWKFLKYLSFVNYSILELIGSPAIAN